MMVCHESLSGSLCPVMSSRLNSHFRHPSGVLCPMGVGSARRGVAWPVHAVVKTPIRSGATPPCPQGWHGPAHTNLRSGSNRTHLMKIICAGLVLAATATATNAFNSSTAVLREALPLPASDVNGHSDSSPVYHQLDELLRMMPDQVELMRRLLSVATNQSSATVARVQALLVLQELVQDLDKAEDFRKLDGFAPVLALIGGEDGKERSLATATPEHLRLVEAAAWVIGTAVQNWRALQLHVVSLGALSRLSTLVRVALDGAQRQSVAVDGIQRQSMAAGGDPGQSVSTTRVPAPLNGTGSVPHASAQAKAAEAAKAKALYAISALVRNNPEGQRACETARCATKVKLAAAADGCP